jgi:ribonuclease D
VLESGERLPEIGSLDGDERRALNQLRETVQHQAKTLDLDPALLASRRELEVAVRAKTSEWPDKFDGWRSQFIGEQLQRWAA